jgi:hypothetical protein
MPDPQSKTSKRRPDPIRQLTGRMNAHRSWAHTEDRAARTAPARRAFLAKFEAMVDAKFTDPADRLRRAENLRQAHMAAIALRSAEARQRSKKA